MPDSRVVDDPAGERVYQSPVPYEAGRINAAALYCSDGRIGDHIGEAIGQITHLLGERIDDPLV